MSIVMALSDGAINLFSPREYGVHCKYVIFPCFVVITFMSISSVIVFWWMAQVPTDDKSMLVIAWFYQEIIHCLSQCWRGFLSLGLS